jgi:hypothetical protein
MPKSSRQQNVTGSERRTQPNKADKLLMQRVNQGRWTAGELQWLVAHLDIKAPPLVHEIVLAKLRQVDAEEGHGHVASGGVLDLVGGPG